MNKATTLYSAESHQSDVKASKSSNDYARRTMKGKYKKLSPFDYISLFTGYVVLSMLAFFGVLMGIGYLSDLLLPVIDFGLRFMYEHILAICVFAVVIFGAFIILPEFIRDSNHRNK